MLDWLKKLFGGKDEVKKDEPTQSTEASAEMTENTEETSSSDEVNQ